MRGRCPAKVKEAMGSCSGSQAQKWASVKGRQASTGRPRSLARSLQNVSSARPLTCSSQPGFLQQHAAPHAPGNCSACLFAELSSTAAPMRATLICAYYRFHGSADEQGR